MFAPTSGTPFHGDPTIPRGTAERTTLLKLHTESLHIARTIRGKYPWDRRWSLPARGHGRGKERAWAHEAPYEGAKAAVDARAA